MQQHLHPFHNPHRCSINKIFCMNWTQSKYPFKDRLLSVYWWIHLWIKAMCSLFECFHWRRDIFCAIIYKTDSRQRPESSWASMTKMEKSGPHAHCFRDVMKICIDWIVSRHHGHKCILHPSTGQTGDSQFNLLGSKKRSAWLGLPTNVHHICINSSPLGGNVQTSS